MKQLFLFLSLIIVVIFVSACNGSSSKDEVKVMRLANATPDDRSLSKALYLFEERLEEETDGSIDVEVYTNSVIGGDREVFEGMQLNTIQGASMSTGPIAQFADSFNVFELPFLFANEEEAYEVLDGDVGDRLLDELNEQNVIGLNYWENGFRMLSNNVREIKTVDDVKGLDIRTLENEWHMELWSELGANPTPMNYGELYIGLEQGTVDAQENPVGNVVNSHFYEVQDHLTVTNHIYNASPFMVSKPFWESLTKEEQAAVQRISDEVQQEQRKMNQQEVEDSFAIVKEKGMKVTELSEEELERFREATSQVRERYIDKYGDEWLKQIEAETN
ncbi:MULTISPECIES: TRAP transporter substrate-binding protein [Terribacillus]|uniref:ABC transporter substrate-binding protein n=1 Tax=Terribacillus saccharophilus TaxID=361277 RepID=A0ABX4H068_9BACI|nr:MULTISPECIES: TRAP transporter substrate-binding protein [Terribacillus]PAD35998.1 ABC transporter substrate-binding protein [Terribacillus saccharophilus]PAD96951.1 ABC transporter substrate-binding protein [Terribacillus saccharophilus]PAE00527.1 ABC transporter substrate-binding protein [Terribacillus saccharophilus]